MQLQFTFPVSPAGTLLDSIFQFQLSTSVGLYGHINGVKSIGDALSGMISPNGQKSILLKSLLIYNIIGNGFISSMTDAIKSSPDYTPGCKAKFQMFGMVNLGFVLSLKALFKNNKYIKAAVVSKLPDLTTNLPGPPIIGALIGKNSVILFLRYIYNSNI